MSDYQDLLVKIDQLKDERGQMAKRIKDLQYNLSIVKELVDDVVGDFAKLDLNVVFVEKCITSDQHVILATGNNTSKKTSFTLEEIGNRLASDLLAWQENVLALTKASRELTEMKKVRNQ